MTVLQVSYPAAASVQMTMALASLASDTNLLAGRASTYVNNYTTTKDLDHRVMGKIRTSATASTAGTFIEVWAYGAARITGGLPTLFPDGITGTDANKTFSGAALKGAILRPIISIPVDATVSKDYDVPDTSIATLFGGMPPFWGLFIVQNTGQALNATQVALEYFRVQATST